MGANAKHFIEIIDGIEVEQPRKKTRRTRQGGKPEAVAAKFKEEKEIRVKPITAKTENQKLYLDSLQSNAITVGRGSAGSGKSWCAASVAANKYLKGEIDQIVVMRPLVGMGKSSGFWPGDIRAKLEPYLLPILNTIKDTIGAAKYEADFGKSILIQPMEAVRGMNFDFRTYVIVDESQNCTPDEIRSLVTRMASGSQAAYCGDDKQRDIPGLSGIQYLCDLIKKHNIPNCGVVEFTPADIVRSGLTRIFVEIFEEEGPSPR